MSFRSEEVVLRLREAHQNRRLAHAYILLGSDRMSLENLAQQIATQTLGSDFPDHPDFHFVHPESKSRRIRIEQMRDLEKNLRLKAYRGGYKVALIAEAERMCLGGADAANAFLKTLEEPPEETLILLTSTEPGQVLPTILSRCVKVMVHDVATNKKESEEFHTLTEQWFNLRSTGSLRAYARATLLTQTWQQTREEIEEQHKGGGEEEAIKATIEGDVLLARQRSIAALQSAYRAVIGSEIDQSQAPSSPALLAVQHLEELHQALRQNVDPALATEACCLRIEE